MKILIVEDQEVTRLVLTTHFRNWGHQVAEAGDGLEALNFLDQGGEADLIVTDWGLPHLDGLELTRRVRERETGRGRSTYIILLTAHGEIDVQDLAPASGGVDDYLLKPFEGADLRRRLKLAERLIVAERNPHPDRRDWEDLLQERTAELWNAQSEIVRRLFQSLSVRDQETDGHLRRLAFFSARLGGYLGWSGEDCQILAVAAPLHDLGKAGWPAGFWCEPKPLSAEEFKIVQTHTTEGAALLAGSSHPSIQWAERIALRHHENWDGSGYPDGLRGEAIPREARVVAVVDVYDAMMADRAYRPGWPEEQVLDFIKSECGRKFDPDIGRLFLDRIGEIRWDPCFPGQP